MLLSNFIIKKGEVNICTLSTPYGYTLYEAEGDNPLKLWGSNFYRKSISKKKSLNSRPIYSGENPNCINLMIVRTNMSLKLNSFQSS